MQGEIYQIFNLDERKLLDLPPEKSREIRNRGSELLTRLSSQGYELFTNFEFIGTIPTSIILCGEANRNFKPDFYTLAQELEIPFSSGDAYSPSAKINRNQNSN